MALALIAWISCGRSSAEERLLVFASASLGPALDAIADAFEHAHGYPVAVHTAGTPRLVLQLTEGAPANVFVSADLESVQRLQAGRPSVTAPRTLAHNRVVVVTARDNPHHLHAPGDLERPELRVAYCGPHVPAGRYARAFLERAGVRVPSISDEPNVRAVVAKVLLGDVDAGIVYHTDALSAGNELHALPVSAAHEVRTSCAFVPLDSSETTEAFVAFLTSETAATILEAHGFETP